jgi:alkylhydroperoxidase family enzyme
MFNRNWRTPISRFHLLQTAYHNPQVFRILVSHLQEYIMPSLTPLADSQASEGTMPLFQALQAKLKMVPNIFRTMGHAPGILKPTLDLNSAIQEDLPPKLRELAYLKTTTVNKCNY